MMMFLFHIWPEQVYRFSTRKWLPPAKLKFSIEEKPIFPNAIIESRTSRIPKVKKANLVFKGSFDIEKLKKLKSPIYVAGFDPPGDPNAILQLCGNSSVVFHYKNASEIIATGKEVIFLTADSLEARKFFELGLPTIFLEAMKLDDKGDISTIDSRGNEQWYNQFFGKKCERISRMFKFHHQSDRIYVCPGSGLAAICSIQTLAEEINVYGWDFYLNSSPDDMSYWQLFFNLYKYGPDVNRSLNHFESALINFYYGYKLSMLPNINIYGYMGQLGKHEKLIKRIERVLFNIN